MRLRMTGFEDESGMQRLSPARRGWRPAETRVVRRNCRLRGAAVAASVKGEGENGLSRSPADRLRVGHELV